MPLIVLPNPARAGGDPVLLPPLVWRVRCIYLFMACRAVPMPRPETRASPSSAGTLLSTVMLLAIIVTTTCQLRTGVAHDIVRPLSNVAEIPASPARSGVKLIAGQVRG